MNKQDKPVMEEKEAEKEAIELYATASSETKKWLEKYFDKKVLSQDICDRVIDYPSACEEIKVKPGERIPFPSPKNDYEKAMNLHGVRLTIAEALQQGKTGWWEPVFRKTSSGFGFSDSRAARGTTTTVAGLRLSFDSEKKSDYFGKLDIHDEYLNSPNKLK